MAAARFRINDDKMTDLRELVRAGWPQRRIAAVLCVGQSTISETHQRFAHPSSAATRLAGPMIAVLAFWAVGIAALGWLVYKIAERM